jgi:formate dehydrogenase subunit gamma
MTVKAKPQIVKDGDAERILRYRTGQRYIHLLLATSFTILLLTGLALVWDPLSLLAEGGLSRVIHRVAAIGFIAVPLLYLLVDRKGALELIKESFSYDKDDVRWATSMYRYFMGHAVDMPPQGRLNAGQKFHHAAVMVLSAGVVISGIILWAFKSSLSASLLAWTVVIHDVSVGALVLLLIGHLYFTVVYKALTSMHTGYVPKDDAQIEHSKWVEEIEREAAETKKAPA